jgi:sigma-B regulation protein RsbU (phosphoserine phosphatase)
LFYGVLDNAKRTLRYVNAGQNPPVVLRRDGSVEWLEASGAPVGMFADSAYEERVVELETGDVVIAYTDGVVEAMDANGEEWGVEGLLKAAMRVAGHSENTRDLVEWIFCSMDRFSGKEQGDDATLAVLRVM